MTLTEIVLVQCNLAAGHQGEMSEPWCNKMVCLACSLIVGQVAAVVGIFVGCEFVAVEFHQYSLLVKLHLVVL